MTDTYGKAPTLIFDGDNTLWRCCEYYDAVVAEGALRIEQYFGLPTAQATELINFLDVLAIKASTNGGFQRTRMGQVFAAAALAASCALHGKLAQAQAQEFASLGDSVFNAPYDAFPGALETLRAYVDAGWRVLLYTKGDPEVQERKIQRLGLRDLVHGVQIVPAKTVESLQALCIANLVDIPQSYMIGDSLKDDIIPAQEVGLQTVHITERETTPWGYEDADPDFLEDVAVLNHVAELLAVIPLTPPVEVHA